MSTQQQRFQKEFFEGGPRRPPKTFTAPMVDEAKKARQTELVAHRVRRLNDEELALQEKPVISEASRRIGSKKTQNVPIELRYVEEQKLKEAKLQKLKRELEQAKAAEENECTFRPSINSKAKALAGGRVEMEDPVTARENKEKRLAKLKLDYLLQESQQLTFKPKLNPRSQQIMAEGEDQSFLDRVDAFQAQLRERREQIRKEVSQQETPFQPNLRPTSNRSISAHRHRARSASCSKSTRKVPLKQDKVAKLKQMVRLAKAQDPEEDRQRLAAEIREEMRENGATGNRERSAGRGGGRGATPKGIRKSSASHSKPKDREEKGGGYVPSLRNLLNQSHLK